jgi:hypothetical protein
LEPRTVPLVTSAPHRLNKKSPRTITIVPGFLARLESRKTDPEPVCQFMAARRSAFILIYARRRTSTYASILQFSYANCINNVKALAHDRMDVRVLFNAAA